jgi:hypothetical protein
MFENNNPKRRGVAPLEFVMQLPFLLGIAAMIASVGAASLDYCGAVNRSRHEVWKLRDDPNSGGTALAVKQVQPNHPLSAVNAGESQQGEVYGEVHKTTNVFSWIGGDQTSKGRSAVLSGSWDHSQVTEFDTTAPHLGVADQMLGGDGSIGQTLGSIISALLHGGLDDAAQNDPAVQQAGDDVDKAEADLEEKKKEVDRQIGKMEEELQRLRDERQKLVDEKNDLIDQRNQKQQELNQLKQQAANSDPVPNSLQQQIDDAEDAIDDLNDQISEKNHQISQKDQEIAHQEDMIQQAKDEREKLGV